MPPPRPKQETPIEDPWKYMAGLYPEHPGTMRRVMVLIYHELNPTEKLYVDETLNWIYLTRSERRRVKEMIAESKNNDLLVEMLRWFSGKYTLDDDSVFDAALDLAEHVTYAVRQPHLYQVEFFQAREKWNRLVGKEDDDMGGTEQMELSTAITRPSEFITSLDQIRNKKSASTIDCGSMSIPIPGSHPTKIVYPVSHSPCGKSTITLNNQTVSWAREAVEPSYPNWKGELLFPNSDEAEMFYLGQSRSQHTLGAAAFQPVAEKGLMLPPGVGPHTAIKQAIKYKDQQSYPLYSPGCGPELPKKKNEMSDEPKPYKYTAADEDTETVYEEPNYYEEVNIFANVELPTFKTTRSGRDFTVGGYNGLFKQASCPVTKKGKGKALLKEQLPPQSSPKMFIPEAKYNSSRSKNEGAFPIRLSAQAPRKVEDDSSDGEEEAEEAEDWSSS